MAPEFFGKLLDLEKKPRGKAYTDAEYNLEGFRRWVDSMGYPYRSIPWIHIAGTKGKGSTAALIESILRAAGLRTGLFTSPHLEHFGQRFSIDGRPWTYERFEQALREIEPFVTGPDADPDENRTAFEVLTAIAFREFPKSGVDVGILETGLGGRLDCTNIVLPKVTVITPIGLDHVGILGDTIEEIAREKAGILKKGVPAAVYHPKDDEQRRGHAVILEEAARRKVPVHEPVLVETNGFIDGTQHLAFEWGGKAYEANLTLAGAHQADNLGLAIRACDLYLESSGATLNVQAIRRGAMEIRWPGRLDIHPGDPVLLTDGAHCSLSARALGASLHQLESIAPPPYVLIWSMQSDKDHEKFLRGFLNEAPRDCVSKVYTIPIESARGAEPALLADLARKLGLSAVACDSYQEAVNLARQERKSILATGSLYPLASIGAYYRENGEGN